MIRTSIITLALVCGHLIVGVNLAKGKSTLAQSLVDLDHDGKQNPSARGSPLLPPSHRGRNYDGVLSVNITVSDAPKLVGLLDELNNPEGTNATITCSIGSGNLHGLSYEWFKNDERLIDGGRGKVRIDTAPDNYISVLRLFNLEANDAGSYTCVAKNRFGQDKISTRLNVKGEL